MTADYKTLHRELTHAHTVVLEAEEKRNRVREKAGEVLRAARKGEHAYRVQIADIMGVSETRVVNMENGVALTPADYERYLLAVDAFALKRRYSIHHEH